MTQRADSAPTASGSRLLDEIDPSPPTVPARCSTAQRRQAMAESQRLGIPLRYGADRRLRVMREPARLACIGTDIHGRRQWLAPPAARAYHRMITAAAAEGIVLQPVSAFRSTGYQLALIRRKLERGQTVAEILRVSAAPGYSEHHGGRVVDLTTPGFAPLEEAFEQSPAFAWLTQHAGRFGFRLSYPRGNRHGIAYEPWHWRWHPRHRDFPAPKARRRSPR